MFKKMQNFRSLEIPMRSSFSYLRLFMYLIIFYLLFSYYQHYYIWIICLLLLITSFFLPYPKISNWRPTIIGYSITGGLAIVLIKAGIVRFGILTLIVGLAISSWLIPNPAIVLIMLLGLIAILSMGFAAPVDNSPPAHQVMLARRNPSGNLETVSGNINIESSLLSPTINEEAVKVDQVYHSNIAEELTEIGWKVWEIIVDQQKRDDFIASEILSRSIDVLGIVGMFVLEQLIDKIIKGRKSDKTKSLRRINTDIKKITNYLETVTKSRKAEMVNATGLSEEQISALLGYLRSIAILVHEKACFWRFRTESDVDL